MQPEVVITTVEAGNQLAAKMERSDEQFEAIVNQIQDATENLTNPAVSQQAKYDAIVSIEFLLVRARLDVEFEHLKVKRILSKPDTPASLRGLFLKRDQYLASVVVKLNAIRDDVSVLQKVVYTQTQRTFK